MSGLEHSFFDQFKKREVSSQSPSKSLSKKNTELFLQLGFDDYGAFIQRVDKEGM